MPKGRKGRSADEIRRDRAELARLYCRGVGQGEIGQRLGISQQQVSYDLAAVRRDWLQSAVRDFDQAKAEQLGKIDGLEREAWDAWERSKRFKVTAITGTEEKTVAKTSDNSPAAPAETKTKEETRKTDQAGDPRFLDRVAWCISERCRILGLYAPTKHKHGGDDDAPPIRVEGKETIDWSKATLEELKVLRELKQKLTLRNSNVVNGSPADRN